MFLVRCLKKDPPKMDITVEDALRKLDAESINMRVQAGALEHQASEKLLTAKRCASKGDKAAARIQLIEARALQKTRESYLAHGHAIWQMQQTLKRQEMNVSVASVLKGGSAQLQRLLEHTSIDSVEDLVDTMIEQRQDVDEISTLLGSSNGDESDVDDELAELMAQCVVDQMPSPIKHTPTTSTQREHVDERTHSQRTAAV